LPEGLRSSRLWWMVWGQPCRSLWDASEATDPSATFDIEAGRGEIRIALRELAAVPEAELHHVKATARTAAASPTAPDPTGRPARWQRQSVTAMGAAGPRVAPSRGGTAAR